MFMQAGDNKRIMNTNLINIFGWKPLISLKNGIAYIIKFTYGNVMKVIKDIII